MHMVKAVLNFKIMELHPDFVNHPRFYVEIFVMENEVMDKMMQGLKKAGLQTI